MLLRLSADQVSRYWDDVRDMLEASVPPLAAEGPAAVNQIMENILLNRMQVWVLYEQSGGGVEKVGDQHVINANSVKIYAMFVTQVWKEPGSFTKNLLIYALYGYSFVPEELWKTGLEGLKRWAKKKQCAGIVAFTKVPRIAEIVRELGGETDTTFLKLEV